MTEHPKQKRKHSFLFLVVVLLIGLASVVCIRLVIYRPDLPVATILPASSAGPTFVVQIVRPRLGLPLGGLLPPRLFGLDAHLGFDSTSEGATVRAVGPGRIAIGADDWDLVLALDGDGRVDAETEVVFSFVFQERLRTVRCRPGDPIVGTFNTVRLGETGELAGSFEIELARCEDVETGRPLEWPPRPLILHGSFDRLPLDGGME